MRFSQGHLPGLSLKCQNSLQYMCFSPQVNRISGCFKYNCDLMVHNPLQTAYGTYIMLCIHFKTGMHAANVCIYNMLQLHPHREIRLSQPSLSFQLPGKILLLPPHSVLIHFSFSLWKLKAFGLSWTH